MTWDDTRGGAHPTTTQTTAAYRSTYNATGGPNNNPVIYNSVYPYHANVGYTLNATVDLGPQFTIFCVGKQYQYTSDTTLLWITRNDGIDSWVEFEIVNNGTSKLFQISNNGAKWSLLNFGGPSIANLKANFYVYACSHNLSTPAHEAWIDGTSVGTSNTNLGSPMNSLNKVFSKINHGGAGNWCELMIWDGVELTSGERTTILNHLKTKWGV